MVDTVAVAECTGIVGNVVVMMGIVIMGVGLSARMDAGQIVGIVREEGSGEKRIGDM